MTRFSLYELNRLVREAIDTLLADSFWLEAEVAEARERGGHCYIDLVEKDNTTNTPIARAAARCWRTTWEIQKPRFEKITGQTFKAGIKVLLKVHPQFHEQYGFSWIIDDIDPTFTLGDLARRRQEIINRLKVEGVFDLNHELKLPLLTQRIAVVSSPLAAGYGDFYKQLHGNRFKLRFETELFEATMQGELVEQSIIAALERIYLRAEEFDCVAIIRGGGATADMSGFDTLALAENVANFPLPIITGIGHERDECILDLIAHTRQKTPTAVATFLVERLQSVNERINQLKEIITQAITHRLTIEKMQLNRLATNIPHLFATIKTKHEAHLSQLYQAILTAINRKITDSRNRHDMAEQTIKAALRHRLQHERHRLELVEQKLKLSDPTILLQRGYSITIKDGKALRDTKNIKKGDIIQTRLAKGTIESKITEIKQ